MKMSMKSTNKFRRINLHSTYALCFHAELFVDYLRKLKELSFLKDNVRNLSACIYLMIWSDIMPVC